MSLKRVNNSAVIQERDVRGTQEFFMTTKLKSGESYQLDYIPKTGEPKRYRHTFSAPSVAEKVHNVTLELLE
jgi:hypothetical protein